MTVSVLFTALFAISGIFVSEIVFSKHKFINRVWLGLVIGLLMLTWLPSLFAFLIGFNLTAQILSAVAALLVLIASVVLLLFRKKSGRQTSRYIGNRWTFLFVVIPILILYFVLLDSHILKQHQDGSLWVGQVTYGDLAMHLGFISSIAEQGTFPPQYSIFPGHALNYPFLCETSGASLYQLGATVRQAYIVSAGYAFITVILGVYLFFEQWLKRRSRAAFATILFFFGGGFGFFYFFDLSKAGGLLAPLLDTYGQTVSTTLLDGFYLTPTNLPALGLRWVNPIVDMLIPQRATLFGWAVLFPCLYLLHGFTFENRNENAVPLAIFAGFLPMIHTHSFLALGVISAVYCVTDLISVRFEKTRLIRWMLYAFIACVLASPQLFLFTFRQTTESNLVRFHLNWANEADSYLWFYFKNLGWIFILMPIAFLVLSKRDRKIFAGALVLWILSECIEFQPNNYDNNKLLFIWFAYSCGLVSKLLLVIKDRLLRIVRKRSKTIDRSVSHLAVANVIVLFIAIFYLFKLLIDTDQDVTMRPGTALTMFFISGLLLSVCIGAWKESKPSRYMLAQMIPHLILSTLEMVCISIVWIQQYQNGSLRFGKTFGIVSLVLCMICLIVSVLKKLLRASNEHGVSRFAGTSVAVTIVSFFLIFTLTASSVMTIVRELKSEYQVYTKNEVELSEQILESTEKDAVILANSYHWNLITPLTGRSIVTGTGTFLYYHGIDTTERERHVAMMFENPEGNRDLFQRYGVKYVLISNAERWNYDIDYSFLQENGTVVAQNDSGVLYRIHS